ncbi:MAG: ribonuclease HII [Mycoplasmataceae bacterium]|jgi:ribonuclease HII|nr:ribonuclease HII [Mycoplasmataceae bacterium]
MKDRPNLYLIEEEMYKDEKIKYIAGIDEVGRGCLAGPLCVGIVIFPKTYRNDLIDDSKKLSLKKRQILAKQIKENALYHSTIFIGEKTIDKINIKNAAKEGMKTLIKQCPFPKEETLFLLDYEKIEEAGYKTISYVKGDARVFSIAGASIIAKVERDEYMDKLDSLYPQYFFKKHKGYPTPLHMQCLHKYGIIPNLYRLSYKPVIDVLNESKIMQN